MDNIEKLEYMLYYLKTNYNNLKMILELRGKTMPEDELNFHLDRLLETKQEIEVIEKELKDLKKKYSNKLSLIVSQPKSLRA